MEECSRLGIFLCYDKDGIIDDYIPYLLNDLKENLDRLVVVVNGKLTADGRKTLFAVTEDVVVRENKGYDAAGWKYAICEYLGWDIIHQYEEMVLLNDSFFGPFYPFRVIFDQMSSRNIDFWGLTAHGEGMELGYYYQRHLQSYFLVIRKAMLGSFEFQQYWEKQKTLDNFWDVVVESEIAFTRYFEDRGFSWEPLIDLSDLNGKHVMNHYAWNVEELLKRGFPVIKRKHFHEDLNLLLMYHNGEDYKKALQYIQEHYQYDVSMIWQNILRLYNIGEIHDAMGLDYVIGHVASYSEKPKCSAVVVLHMTYTEELEHYKPYIKAIPKWVDVIITTISEDREELLKKTFGKILGRRMIVVRMYNRGRDLAAMLVAAKPYILKYDYFCFCHDKISKQTEYSIGKYFERLLWENTLSSTAYIENMIDRFDKEPHLGILSVPAQIGGFVGQFGGKFWTINYQHTVDLLKKLHIEVPVSASVAPISIGTAFWCRTVAIKKLLEYPWDYEDFPKEPLGVDGEINHALERCFPFVAQSMGYYTAVAMTPEYAEILVNAYKYLAYHSLDNGAKANYMCMTDSNMPDVGIRGALHLLRLTIKRYFRKKSSRRC